MSQPLLGIIGGIITDEDGTFLNGLKTNTADTLRQYGIILSGWEYEMLKTILKDENSLRALLEARKIICPQWPCLMIKLVPYSELAQAGLTGQQTKVPQGS